MAPVSGTTTRRRREPRAAECPEWPSPWLCSNPADPGSSFDWNYFLNHHIPLIETALEIEDTGRIEVALGLSGAAPGESAAYQAVLLVDFDSITAFYHRWRQQQHRVMGDIVNFTNTRPASSAQ